MSWRLLVAILLVSVAVALLVVANIGEPPNIENEPPKPTISPTAITARPHCGRRPATDQSRQQPAWLYS